MIHMVNKITLCELCLEQFSHQFSKDGSFIVQSNCYDMVTVYLNCEPLKTLTLVWMCCFRYDIRSRQAKTLDSSS